MNGFDDLFVKDNEGKDSNQRQFDEKEFDKDAWAEKKKQERADAYALIDDGTETIMQDSEVFRDFLNVQARFDRYSVSNAILIAHQMPEATRLADFDGWKNHDYTIKKGETAITILEPGNEYTKEDGTKAFSVNVKKVFDITQTVDGKAVNPKYPEQRKAIKALISSAPCDIVMDSEKAGEKLAVYSPDAATLREKKVSDLKNRAALINSTENAFVISIHQNSLPTHPKVHGAKVFYNTIQPAAQAAQPAPAPAQSSAPEGFTALTDDDIPF